MPPLVTTLLSFGLNTFLAKDEKPIVRLPENPTEEEKQIYLAQQASNTASRRAARFLAILIGLVWGFMLVVPVIVEVFGGMPLESVKQAASEVHGPMMMILGFYFGRDYAKGIFETIGNAISSKKK